jgi:hypothetical protein
MLFVGASYLFVGFFVWLLNPNLFSILSFPLLMLGGGLLFAFFLVAWMHAFLEFSPWLKTWRKMLLAGVFLLIIGLTFMRARGLGGLGYFIMFTGLLACATAIADIIEKRW